MVFTHVARRETCKNNFIWLCNIESECTDVVPEDYEHHTRSTKSQADNVLPPTYQIESPARSGMPFMAIPDVRLHLR